MNGKTVIITGANSGIGKETARKMASLGARVIMACRNLETAKEAQEDIIKTTGNSNVILKKLDLSSQKSVREFAADINETENKLNVLIHNAGMSLVFRREKSVDGIELTMATNHYGPFLLTHMLIDLLKQSAPSRIVIVSSKMYNLSSVNLNNLNPVNIWPPLYLYFVSKFANIYFCLELARRLVGSGVTTNCLHPGVINSGIWKSVPVPCNYPMRCIARLFMTTEEGAQTSIYLASSSEVEGVTGKYFRDSKEAQLNHAARDVERGVQLWEQSLKIVKLDPETDPTI